MVIHQRAFIFTLLFRDVEYLSIGNFSPASVGDSLLAPGYSMAGSQMERSAYRLILLLAAQSFFAQSGEINFKLLGENYE